MRNTHLLHLLVFILMKCSVDEVLCAINGERGSTITLNPQLRGKLEKVTWTHNGNTAVEYDQSQVLIFDPFKKRIVLDFQSGELTVKRLTTGDDGVYESTAIVNGKNQYSKHELQVIAGVPQPKVTCKQADPESEETTLLCGVEVDTPVRYRWRGPTVYDHLGSELRLGKQEDLDSVYTCIVKNEISEKQATFTLRDCQSGGISPGIIAVVILSAICALCLLILIPLLVCRRKQKLLKKNPAHKQADIENGENKNLLSSGQATNKNTGGKKESRGLYRAVHLNRQSGAIEDAENEERSSFSLRATLPSHAKLRPPRAGDEQANGSFGAKDRNSPDRSTASGLQQEDRSAEFKPVPVERVTLDQKAVVVPSQLHGKHLASAVISHSSSSAEEPDIQLNAVNYSRRNSENDGRSNLNPEGVSEEMKPYHSHNITVTTEGKDRRECCGEEDDVSDTERGADMTSERGVAEEKDGNDEQQTASENGQEEESSKQEKEDSGSHLKNQENHEMVVEEGSVDKERNGERVPPDQTEEEEANDREHKEELPEVEQAIQEHLKEDAPKDEIKNVQDDQDEAAMDPEPERTGNEGESGIVRERKKTAEEKEEVEEEDITTKKQPLPENEQGSSIPEPQEMMEPEVQKDLTGVEGEQELHVSEGLEEGRTGEHDGVEDGEMGPDRTCHDVREGERERKGEDEQGDGVEVDTNHREEEGQDGEMAGQQQDELRREERQEPDEETVGVNSELEDQLLKQASNTSLKEPQIDCPDVSVSDEMNGEESEDKSENEGTKSNTQVEEKKQEEPNPLKQGEDHSIPKEELFSLEEQGSCLPEDQIDCPDVSVSDEVNGEESEMKLESVGTEYNTPLEEKKQEKQNPLKQGEDQSIPKGAAVEEQDSCLPEDQRTDEVISDENETQDDHELDGKTETVDNQATQDQAKEEEFKQEQTEQDQHQNDTNSPHEHEQAGKTEKKDEENNTEIEPENESSQEQEKEASELTKTESDGERDMEPSGQLQSEEHLEHKDEEHLEHKDEEHLEHKDEEQLEHKDEEHLEHKDEEHLEHKDEEHLEHKDEEQGKEEDIGQPDNTQLQAQPLKEEQHVDINLEEGKDNKTISDSDGEKEGKGQKKEDSKLEEEGEAGETDTDQVQEEAHPAVSNEEVIAMDEKEHSVTEDETVESVSDVREAEKLYPTEEEDVERKQERTQKDGQQDDQNNSVPDDNKEKGDQNKSVPDDNMEKEDQNKSVPDDNKEKEDQNNSVPDDNKEKGDQNNSVPDDNKEKGDQNNSVPDDNKEKEDKKYNEVNPNRESDKETLLEEERGDTEVHQGRTEGEQHHTEVPGQLQNEQKQVENHDDDDDDDYEEERMSDGEESVEGKALEDQMKHQMERPNNKSDTCENNKDGRDVVPEKNGNRNDYQAEKEGREKVEIKCEEMHQDDMAKQDRASY